MATCASGARPDDYLPPTRQSRTPLKLWPEANAESWFFYKVVILDHRCYGRSMCSRTGLLSAIQVRIIVASRNTIAPSSLSNETTSRLQIALSKHIETW
ncbi:hypothetical protein POX_d05057 [Penicillium oxalicum]|uniref:Uncharacterized protein n=1 Tax=Penicillium oxalicum (strain 114-2 / CGMCC 5302) TaxID=933388 RepID=S7ZQW2_PENO1|nr:hypothetical protein POX_d05057 [Penicillium oxalicum]EPS32789.1 hypothetical protein PDE_07749 [Penicillium oxalicum 114-2]KAI2789563.1 hypothetical protein POX_d05057 [Penicillium oxalicum]